MRTDALSAARPARTVVGRDAELAAIRRLLGGEAGPAALVIEGDAGIGKTAVWREGLALAADLDVQALSCRPAEAEAALPFVALGDLVEPVLEEVLPAVAPPQRAALEAALLQAEPSGA
ncbi:MAG: AAA family ATPase, partial [Gaiellaceae bacterium]